MRPRRIVANRETVDIIENAVRERALAVVTFQQALNWISFKSRFLERDPNHRFFVLDLPTNPADAPPELVPGQYVGLSFRHKSRKVMFATLVEARGRFMVDERTQVPAIRYRWPESMTEMQRRAYYRTQVPPGTSLIASFWPGGVSRRGKAQLEAVNLFTGQVLDLSCGGALVALGNRGLPSEWSENMTLGLELNLPDGRPPIVVDAFFRGERRDSREIATVALQFIGLEMTPDGRSVLQRLSRCVQQFHRLTVCDELRSGTARFSSW